MQIVIPLSGEGSRFKRAGYTDIKPLIEIDGRPMIEHVVAMFPGETDFLFICAKKHLRETPLRSVLERIAPTGKIVGVEQRKLGPVDAVLQAKEYIKEAEPVVVNYTDFSVYWDWAGFKRTMRRVDPAGCVTAYRGFHPHSLGPNLYAYMRSEQRADGGHYMLEIQEKHCFTDDRMNEFASSGTYYFRSGRLLKETFEQAVAQDLRTNGEFYASMPFNLLVAQDLPVYIYELEHFLQWGTPEDLEEYQAWSEYFARWSDWRPSLAPAEGANLIPMAGSGERFRREGYLRPKPLVAVDEDPMIRRVLRSLPPAAEWVAVCRTEHLNASGLIECLDEGRSDVTIVPVNRLTEGQACTCLLGQDYIDPGAPLLIAPCDAAFVYDEERYHALTTSGDADCLVWTFRNHPHANRNPRQYGWAMTDAEGWIQRISCKVPLAEGNVRNDQGIIGAFWFREARFFFEAAEELIRRDERVNGEFYVDTSIEMLLQMGRRARVFDVDAYICFGVPDDVRTYEYWVAYFRKAARDTYAAMAA
jgi:NDP-sugar pyrophosphorylase family protein